MGLSLDAQMLPVGMKIFPGNESEKPVMRDLIHDLKSRNNIKAVPSKLLIKALTVLKILLKLLIMEMAICFRNL